jgi:predicted kinase
MPKLTIVRGLPGSGKSTIAKKLGVAHFEADMFFMMDGKYEWSPASMSTAHRWCQDSVRNCMTFAMDVVVSNTFTQKWEMKHYLDLAEQFGYEVEVIRCTAQYGNTHNVPEETLQKMAERFEDVEREIFRL